MFSPCFIFRNPGVYNKWSNEVLKPFHEITWYTIIGFSTVLCICIKYFHAKESQLLGSGKYYPWSTCVLSIIGSFTQQGTV